MAKWSHNELVLAKVRDLDPNEVYAELVGWQKSKGYKAGWVAWQYKKIYEEWPPWSFSAVGKPPRNELIEAVGILNSRERQKQKREEIKQGRMVLGALRQPMEFSNEA